MLRRRARRSSRRARAPTHDDRLGHRHGEGLLHRPGDASSRPRTSRRPPRPRRIPDTPRSVPRPSGARRPRPSRHGAGAVTVLSLDNLLVERPTLRGGRARPRCGRRRVARPVDRRAPGVSEQHGRPAGAGDRRRLPSRVATAIGLDDAWPVRAEPYSQWVVERTWATTMPPLADVGVQVVDDVAPWEIAQVAGAQRVAHGRRALRPASTGSTRSTSSPATGRASAARPGRGGDRRGPRRPARRRRRRVRRNDAHIASPTPDSATAVIRSPPTPARSCPAPARHDPRPSESWRLPIYVLADVLALWAWSTLGRRPSGSDTQPVADPLAPTVRADRGRLHHRRPHRAHALSAALIGLDDLRRPRRQPLALVGGRRHGLPALLDPPNTWRRHENVVQRRLDRQAEAQPLPRTDRCKVRDRAGRRSRSPTTP